VKMCEILLLPLPSVDNLKPGQINHNDTGNLYVYLNSNYER